MRETTRNTSFQARRISAGYVISVRRHSRIASGVELRTLRPLRGGEVAPSAKELPSILFKFVLHSLAHTSSERRGHFSHKIILLHTCSLNLPILYARTYILFFLSCTYEHFSLTSLRFFLSLDLLVSSNSRFFTKTCMDLSFLSFIVERYLDLIV